jgi:hypothetical protein
MTKETAPEKTLRDEIAIAALTGLLANEGKSMSGFEDSDAKKCYQYADAMLAARGNKDD